MVILYISLYISEGGEEVTETGLVFKKISPV
jgi:hypothetical protein